MVDLADSRTAAEGVDDVREKKRSVPLPRPRDDLAKIRGSDEFAKTRYHIWQAIHAGTVAAGAPTLH